MKYLSALASIIACATAMSVISQPTPFAEHPFRRTSFIYPNTLNHRPQLTSLNPGGPIQPCTYTTTACTPPAITSNVETITVYEVPVPQTVTETVDCDGCADVSVVTDCTYVPGVSFLPASLRYGSLLMMGCS